MKIRLKLFLISVIMLFLISCGGGEVAISVGDPPVYSFLGSGDCKGEYFPTDQFRECTPEQVGMNSEKLVKVYNYAANPEIKTEGLIIIKNNYIVLEAYLNGFSPDKLHESYSIAKSITSCLVGIAIDKGYIQSENQPVYPYFEKWENLPETDLRKKITIRHLLTMTSGLEWNEEDYYGDTSKNDAFIMYQTAENYIDYVLNKECVQIPGTRWYYSSGDTMLLSGVIQKAVMTSPEQFAKENLFDKMGIKKYYWEKDKAGNSVTAWGIGLTLREYAKFGLLYLNNGYWDGERIVSGEWVEKSSSPCSSSVNWYGYSWWRIPIFENYFHLGLPSDIYFAWGIYTQQIFIIPDYKIVVVRLGNDNNPQNDKWVETEFLKLVIDCVETK